MYTVGDTHSHMFPVGNGRRTGGSLACRQWGRSVTHVPSRGWWRRGGSVSCTQWGTLTHICSPVGDGRRRGGSLFHVHSGGHSLTYVPSVHSVGCGEERRISAMYAVGDTHSYVPSGG